MQSTARRIAVSRRTASRNDLGFDFEGFFALDPVVAVRAGLPFPDRHGLFQRVDAVTAGFERLRAVRRSDRDDDARLSPFDAPDPMPDHDLAAPAGFGLLRDAAHPLF